MLGHIARRQLVTYLCNGLKKPRSARGVTVGVLRGVQTPCKGIGNRITAMKRKKNNGTKLCKMVTAAATKINKTE